MDKKIEEYVNNLFLRSSLSIQSKNSKEKLLSISIKFYKDLIKSNLSETEAYERTISYINETYDLMNSNLEQNTLDKNPRKKYATLTSIAVMLYILCPVPIIILDGFGYTFEKIGVVLLFFMIASATGLLIYNNITKSKSFYNEFYEHSDEYSKYYKVRKSISSMLWALIVAFYFFISFRYMIWGYSWIIFLIGAALEQVLKAYFDYKEEKEYEKKF